MSDFLKTKSRRILSGLALLIAFAFVFQNCGQGFKALSLQNQSSLGTKLYSVELGWDRNTDSLTSGYRIYYGTQSGVYNSFVDMSGNPGNPRATIPDLVGGHTYYFSVKAFDNFGRESQPSVEVSVYVE